MFASLLQAAVALSCAALALATLSGRPLVTSRIRAQRPLRWVWGVPTTLAAAALFAAIWIPFFTFFAASALIVLMLAALATMLLQGRRGGGVGWLAVLLVCIVAVGALQPLGLKVLALPKADVLPHAPVSAARVVKTYGPGMWFEGIAAAPDGTLYLAQNTGENYATGDKSHVHASVIARAPDGSERVFFTLPQGSTAGVMAIAANGTIYMAGTGANRGLWRIEPNGTGRLFAPLPKGAWPNGVTLGPDGNVYVADAALGTIWRVDPRSGAAAKAYEGDVLRARTYIALPPGANGLHFFGRDLYVTVSDAGTLLKFHLGDDGRLAAPTVAARGVPADDFAIDSHGAVFLTTHIYNQLVRVDADGRRTVIADAAQGVIGATDAVFGTGPDDRDTLYLVTDGGALATGDAAARGTLVALSVGTH